MSKYGNQKVKAYGIEFDSKLELYVYQMFKSNKYDIRRCEDSFELIPKFKHYNMLKGKLEGIRAVKYTPDFLVRYGNETIVLEVKGFPSKDYPLRKKMFLQKYGNDYMFIEIHSQKECLQVLAELNN
jgi:5-methylcytosine-specific restriction endonuclease McrBC regulatory subunit McrC